MQKATGFEDRFLSKLSKIDRQEIESFLSNLVREKHFLQIVFNAMLDGIVVLRPNLEVIYTNESALDLLGINARRRVIGERIAALVPIAEFAELVSRYALHGEKILTTEVETTFSPGRTLSISLIPLEGSSEHQSGSSVIIVHDATEARRHAEEKRKAERATTLANLTAGLAHEIKNPLNSLQIHAQLLQKALKEPANKSDRSRVLQSSDIIVEEIRRLSGVVDNFLSAVRPTHPQKAKTDVNQLVERVIATILPEAEGNKIQIALRLDHDIPKIELDPNQMTQAILNLIKNAMEALSAEHTMAGDAGAATGACWDCRIEIRTELGSGEFRIRVADNGPGIPEEDLRKILEPYFTTKFSGTGLGLAIVSRIVEEHGGTMEISSKPGGGTVVTLRFPLTNAPRRMLEEHQKESL